MNNVDYLIESEAFSSIDLVHQCLMDADKATAFKSAIKAAVTSESIVLEFGTGSGILSLLAAEAGAKKVTAVEFDPFIANVARENIHRNNKDSIIEIIVADARTVKFPGAQFDVVIMEMINTGLVEEMQVQAMNNLHTRQLIGPATKIIPSSQKGYVTLAQTNFFSHGFEMKMIKHIWSFMEPDTILLSERELLNHTDFTHYVPESFSNILRFTVHTSGKVNSIILSGETILNSDETMLVGKSWSMNPDIIIPLKEREVKDGDTINVSFNYFFGGGFQNFRVDIED